LQQSLVQKAAEVETLDAFAAAKAAPYPSIERSASYEYA